jgi:hypothetical protein
MTPLRRRSVVRTVGPRGDQGLADSTGASSISVAVAALKFVYTVTLKWPWVVEDDAVKSPKHRMILTLSYATGLRISEAVCLNQPRSTASGWLFGSCPRAWCRSCGEVARRSDRQESG